MKRILFTAGIVLILASLFLGVLFFGGYRTTTLAVGPQRPVGPPGSVGPGAVEVSADVTEAGPNVAGVEGGADTKVILGLDWAIMVACGLVLRRSSSLSELVLLLLLLLLALLGWTEGER